MEEYIKDFDGWNKTKQELNYNQAEQTLIQEGSVWLVRVGVNVGSEIDGKGEEFVRPVIVIKKINKNTFFGLPVSSKIKTDNYRIKFKLFNDDRIAVISQLKVFDRKRCVRFMIMLESSLIIKLSNRVSKMFTKAETPQPHDAVEGNLRCLEGDNMESIDEGDNKIKT